MYPIPPLDLYASAIEYARRGHAVFPCQPRGKEPACAHGLADAVADPEGLWWWRSCPTLNIGIATGAVSGFWVLDVDDDKNGEASLRELEAKHGALPPTIEVITGKGRHLWFRIGEHGPVKNSVSEIAPGQLASRPAPHFDKASVPQVGRFSARTSQGCGAAGGKRRL